jgi:hypothetical protein
VSVRVELLDTLLSAVVSPEDSAKELLGSSARVAARSLEAVALRSSATTERLLGAVREHANADSDDLVMVLTAASDGEEGLLEFALSVVNEADASALALRLAALAVEHALILEDVTGLGAHQWVQEWVQEHDAP